MAKQLWLSIFFLLPTMLFSQAVYDISSYGGNGDGSSDTTAALTALLNDIDRSSSAPIQIVFPKGTYRFESGSAVRKEYYISNHDQDNPKAVGIPLEDFKNVTVEGNGSRFLFHGRMLPLSLVRCENVTLQNFSIDFDDPKIAQLTLKDKANGIFEVSPEINFRIENGKFAFFGDDWKIVPSAYMVFDGKTGHILPQTGDSFSPIFFTIPAKEVDERTIRMDWATSRYPEGTVLTLRSWERPTPGIFIHLSKDVALKDVVVHFAEGMGLLAQMTENLHLNGFKVALAEGSGRFFTTQADATHFSGCKGTILSENGLYENMMDDAINVHGTYLSIDRRENETTVIASYRHKQTFGFDWGFPGDSVDFVEPKTMESFDHPAVIQSIEPIGAPVNGGVKKFRIVFEKPLDRRVKKKVGIENRTWMPSVVFRNNTIRNNRARGTLFSTLLPVLVENNFFDHTSGTALLLCGDCNGWFESGACRDVVIRGNRFVNALTSLYQFTEAVISICPEIPAVGRQQKYFHSGIVIEKNSFDTFDRPILYALSTDGIVFRDNDVKRNHDFEPFHSNQATFLFDRCLNIEILKNRFDESYDWNPQSDIRLTRTSVQEVKIDSSKE